MKLLLRNTTEFEYLPYTGVDSDLNDDNEHTGEYHHVYGDPVWYRGNISSPSNEVNQTLYGTDIRYTHTLLLDDPNAAIDEYGQVRWRGDLYDIQAVIPSINSLTVALQKRTKDHAPAQAEPEGDGE